ncbi:MAG: tRNA preQ1(34) S-adenosylmethionine ribosyltransferase-isomerase QueA [Proteobacteria bacterium]|nr:tRNA preQ1(34) S-adenosylmethionine ribosyltransferase-isomerase QueA [Pseudomonadota bacterium]
MKTDDFDYYLPPELIAQKPCSQRNASRLLVVGQANTDLQDCQFSDFVAFCQPGDLLVVNNTRVVPARLQCRKASGGQVEVMLERMLSNGEFLALTRSNKPLKPGLILYINDNPELEFISREGAFFKFKMLDVDNTDEFDVFHRLGEMPLPPYIKRAAAKQDSERYQTVYAQTEGAVAAPTAGLHFDAETLERLASKGVDIAQLTLHVGAGTFQPVKVENIEQHTMHKEWIEVGDELVEKIVKCKRAGKRVIAVGTTTVRALESAAQHSFLSAFSGPTDIFIYPGYEFKVVDSLLTNFHLPKSTLLMMISAFAGTKRIKAVYRHAVAARYRFFSYGDAMLLNKGQKSTGYFNEV